MIWNRFFSSRKQASHHKKVNNNFAEEKYSSNNFELEFISSALWHSFNMPRSGADKIFPRLLIVRSQLGCLACQLTYSSTDGNCGHTKIPISGSRLPSLSLYLSWLIFGIFQACIDCRGHSGLGDKIRPAPLPSS